MCPAYSKDKEVQILFSPGPRGDLVRDSLLVCLFPIAGRLNGGAAFSPLVSTPILSFAVPWKASPDTEQRLFDV